MTKKKSKSDEQLKQEKLERILKDKDKRYPLDSIELQLEAMDGTKKTTSYEVNLDGGKSEYQELDLDDETEIFMTKEENGG